MVAKYIFSDGKTNVWNSVFYETNNLWTIDEYDSISNMLEQAARNFTMKSVSYKPNKIIWNNPFTTVLWSDGTKTVVKAKEGEEFNPEVGFLYALAKKVYGSRSGYQKMIEEVGYREFTKEEKKAYREAKKAKREEKKSE